MITVALIGDNCISRSNYMATVKLPAFYMEDFSVLGITVESYERASSLLRKAGFDIADRPGGGEIVLPHRSCIPIVMEFLMQRGLPARYGDIADTMYQA